MKGERPEETDHLVDHTIFHLREDGSPEAEQTERIIKQQSVALRSLCVATLEALACSD